MNDFIQVCQRFQETSYIYHLLLHHLKEFFSVTGLTISKLRSILSSENFNALLFLNKKLKEF